MMDELEKETRLVFDRVRKGNPVMVPPFLASRVLARLNSPERNPFHGGYFWRGLALFSTSLSLLLTVWILWGGRSGGPSNTQAPESLPTILAGKLNEPVLVRVEVQEMNRNAIARAEIDLPDGVRFYSQSHPELNDERRIEVAWSSLKYLPFAIQAVKPGVHSIVVHFFDEKNQLVIRKEVKIQFGV